MSRTNTRSGSDRERRETNSRFYDALWTDARLIEPERFNTWPLVDSLVAQHPRRLEVAPGLRPRLPIEGTHFVDQSAPAVAKLRGRGARAVRGRVTSIPFADGVFDLVCAFDIVEHIHDDETALSELARVAAGGAVFLLSVPLHESRWTAFDDLVGHCRRYDPEQLRARLAAFGFSVEQSAVFGMKLQSSRLLDLGMWFLTHRREKAMWWYNRVFMPLGLRFQKTLSLAQGLVDADELDEILIVCRKHGDGFFSIKRGSEHDESTDDERSLDRIPGWNGMHDRRHTRDGRVGESGPLGRVRTGGRCVAQGGQGLHGYGAGPGRSG